jgi:hypothetical protein
MGRLRFLNIIIYTLILHFAFLIVNCSSHAELIERVVAIVNDEVILLSEFNDAYKSAVLAGSRMTEEEFLDDMINRVLILEQAKRFRFEGSLSSRDVSDNILVEKYLEKRIKAFIHIPFEDIENYYLANPALFEGRGFYEVRDEIEAFLIDEKLGAKMYEHIEELRDNAYIRVQLKPSD